MNKNVIAKIILLCIISAIIMPSAMAEYEPTDLTEVSVAQTVITWSWTANDTQYNTSVYVNSVFMENVTSPETGTQSYTATGLTRGTAYTISIISWDGIDSYSDPVELMSVTRLSGIDVTTLTTDINAALEVFWLLPQSIVDNFGIFVSLVLLGAIMGLIGTVLIFLRKLLVKKMN